MAQKKKTFTRKQLHRAALTRREEAPVVRKVLKKPPFDRELAKTEAAFRGCDIRRLAP